jgi:dipeptidyl aminopeptidase/acylaminoacyl peptidase
VWNSGNWGAAWVGVPFDSDVEGYLKLSPVYHLAGVTTPMLIAVGDKDSTDFLLDAVEMYAGLRRLNKPVTLLRYPNEGHGFQGAAMDDFWAREMAFFKKYLQ